MKNKDLIRQMESYSIADHTKAPPEQKILIGDCYPYQNREQYNKNEMIVQTTKTQTS